MKTVRVHILKERYTQKPNRKEMGKISKNVTENIYEMELLTFAEEVGENGHAFTTAIFNGDRNTENFSRQEIFAMDFDKGLTVGAFMEKAKKYNVLPVFLYATYNYTEEDNRFRAVFISDCIAENAHAAKVMNGLLLELFPEADTCSKDISHFFLGGKKLLYFNEYAKINLKDIAVSVQVLLKEKDRINYSRKIKKIGKDLNIAVEHGLLCIHKISEIAENEEYWKMPYIIMGDSLKSSNSCVFHTQTHLANKCEKKEYKEYKEIYNKTSDFLFRVCPLFKALYERELPHNYKFLLATNLVHVKGGKTMFFSGIIENQEKWEVHWKYIKNYYNHPQSCENGECPYATQCRCKSLYEKLTRSIIRIESEEKYISLEEASYMMKREIASSIDRKGDMITLIRAQTSLGKTTAYCSMAKDWNKEKKLLIVVPTIKLQEQVQDDLRKVGVYAYKTENIRKLLEELELIDLLEQVENLYNKGFGGRVKRIIKEYIKSNPEIDKVKLMRLERYLETNERLNGKNHVVTTHAMFLALPEIILKQYEIIVDEDILMTIFKGTSSISFEELEIAKQAGILPIYVQQNLNRILAMQNGSLGKIKLIEDMQEMEETVYEADLPIGSSLLDFLMSDTYYVDANEKIIHYYKAKKLPNVKMTIVSASVNKKLYQDYASNRRIRFIDIPQVKYCGKLIQYTQHSMSRSFIHETGRERIMDSIATITGEETKIISFKMINEDADIYFGKTEGFNDYKGVNLAVVGTPHSIPFVYQLIGKYLGYSSEEGMNVRYAEHNGYGFSIMTFEDEAMRNLQFHFLESELEQAIGRARLLRFPCTVYLFSNYPCRQAEIIQDEYLIAENE